MKVLSTTEIQAVSGAGKVQDMLSQSYGALFSNVVTTLNKVFDLGYEVETAQQAGQDFGSRLGLAIETSLTNFLDAIRTNVVG
jgi:hypothetical protein